jgi:hypothetical protein
MNATITKCSEVKVGDRITEIDTPSGPWYAVLKINMASYVLESASAEELANGESYPMTFRFRPTDGVLVAHA